MTIKKINHVTLSGFGGSMTPKEGVMTSLVRQGIGMIYVSATLAELRLNAPEIYAILEDQYTSFLADKTGLKRTASKQGFQLSSASLQAQGLVGGEDGLMQKAPSTIVDLMIYDDRILQSHNGDKVASLRERTITRVAAAAIDDFQKITTGGEEGYTKFTYINRPESAVAFGRLYASDDQTDDTVTALCTSFRLYTQSSYRSNETRNGVKTARVSLDNNLDVLTLL